MTINKLPKSIRMTDYGTKLPTSVIFDDFGHILLLRKGSQKFRTTITSCSEADHLYLHGWFKVIHITYHRAGASHWFDWSLVLIRKTKRCLVDRWGMSNIHFLNCLAIDVLVNMAIRWAPRNEKYARFFGNFLRASTWRSQSLLLNSSALRS